MKVIQPTWMPLKGVHAFTTTREGGVSSAPFDSLNLGDHVSDNPELVAQNRKLLQENARLPQAPVYLTQTHSTRVIRLPYTGEDLNADAVYTNQANQVCLVMTADCLPVIFASFDGKEVAVAHAGWKGLCNGVLENTAAEFECAPSEIQVWLGPAISQKAFQVGGEVCEQFCAFDPNAKEAFIDDPNSEGKLLGDLYQIARQRLNKLGITQIFGGDYCTYTESQFFSYRRENVTGRMATLIWRE